MKHQVKNTAELREAINQLELKTHVQEVKMKDHYEVIKDNLKPKNLLKNVYSTMAENREVRKTLLSTIIGFAMGYAYKKSNELLTEQSLDNLVHHLVDVGLTQLETHNPGGIVSKGVTMFRKTTPETSPIYPFVRYK